MRIREFAKTIWFTLIVAACFAIAMAYLEVAVVVYLRALFKIVGEIQPAPPDSNSVLIALPFFAFLQPHYLFNILPDSKILGVELFREIATIVMLITVGWLTGRSLREKFAFFLYVFGLWDIFYYVFLYLILGWPTSLKTLDVLFLIPVPWVAPVFVPVGISLLMITGAILLIVSKEKKILPSLKSIKISSNNK